MSKAERRDILRVILVFGAAFALIVGLAVAGILFRSPDVEVDQTVYTLGLTVSPNPLPDVGLNDQGRVNYTFELTVSNPYYNPNLTLTLHLLPSAVANLTVRHCLENSQPQEAVRNDECDKGELEPGAGVYYANVTSGSSVVFRIQVVLNGTITEPVTLHWTFWAEGEEIPEGG